jgi:amino acid adenylation domain-containing protein
MSNERVFPTSFAQQRLLFLDQFDPGLAAYNLTRAIRMVGPLDPGALTETLRRIAARHASLRTNFRLDSEASYQIVCEQVTLQLPLIDMSHFQESVRRTETLRSAREEGNKSFNLTSGPLFRPILLRLSSVDHVLVLVLHHIIADAWSMSILFKEIEEIYTEIAHAKPSMLPPISIQYSDFARWQREHFTTEALDPHLRYWTNKLSGHSGFLELPIDRLRPPVRSHNGALETFQIAERLTKALTQIAESSGATLFMLLLAALQTLVWRYTGTDDILIGTPIAGRNDPQLERLIGLFVNTLVIRGNLSGNPSFLELLQRTRAATLEAYEHQDLPFEKLVEAVKPQRNLGYTPLVQIMFVFQNTPKQILDLHGLRLEELELDSGSTKFDLTLEIVPQDGLHCEMEYATDLFNKESIQQFTRHFETLLDDIAKNPERPISDLNILDDAAQNQLIFEFNSTNAKYRHNIRIEQLFEQQVNEMPTRVALIESGSQITYEELNARANALARLLLTKRVSQDRPVGVFMRRSIDAVVALLAALKVNTPYVPLDIANPRHRLELLIDDSGCDVILTQRGLEGALPTHVEAISLDDLSSRDIGHSECDGHVSSHDLAYIMYTSGSTGVPKGVEGSHRAVINRLEWMWRRYPFSSDETCCQKTALGFVDSVWEIFGPLLAGIRAVIVTEEVLLDVDKFVALLADHEVSRIVLVPSLLRTLLDLVPNLATRLPKLLLWSASGEILPPDLVSRFREVIPRARLLNIYGSSEVTADVTWHEANRGERLTSVPIGKPISNTQIFILDEKKNLVPPLVRGEIHVGGDCLARGYWRQPELTSQRFIPNPYLPYQSRFLFATGDVGRILADGSIEYLGRLDQQIKLRGMRIEPGEIEANLTAHPLVRQAIVAVYKDPSQMQHLVAYIVCSEGSTPLGEELRRFLRTRLPEYMIPTTFVELRCMPLLPSGKIDRGALPNPSLEVLGKHRTIVPWRTEIERGLSLIWQEVLSLDAVSIDDNFFELGGHSLSALRVLARIRRDFHVDVPIRSLFDRPTIAELALEVEQQTVAGRGSPIAPIASPGAGSSSALLSFLRAELSALSPDQLDALLHSVGSDRNAKAHNKS